MSCVVNQGVDWDESMKNRPLALKELKFGNVSDHHDNLARCFQLDKAEAPRKLWGQTEGLNDQV
jgi:hypothetical protein